VREELLHLPALGLWPNLGDVVDLHEPDFVTLSIARDDGDRVVVPLDDLRLHVTSSEDADPPLDAL
jgi:hypothetical protein